MKNAAMVSALQAKLGALVMGTDAKQRRFVIRTLMAMAVYAVSIVTEMAAVALGVTRADEALGLVVCMAIGPIVFLVLVRSGWSRRLNDPSMTLAQMGFAIAILTLAYPVNGPMRGLNIFLMALVPLFGFLQISRRQAQTMCLLSVLLLGGTMLGLAMAVPHRFEPRVEFMHFMLAALCLPSMTLQLMNIAALRARAQAQGEDLKQALQRIEAMSIRDDLTGLYNRHHMTSLLNEELRRRQRGGPAFCLALIDLDHFKQINDRHGHALGDEALRRFARIASQGMEGAALLARWGGEEFLLMLPATPLAAAAEVLARWRERLRDSADEPAAALQVTFSAGLIEDGHRPLSVLLELADQALYRAKAGGRDRVEQVVTVG